MARRVLVGELHRAISKGWLAKWTDTHEARSAASQLLSAESTWVQYLGESQRSVASRLFAAMINEGLDGRLPVGWLPADADDAILVELFIRHWVVER